MPAFSASIGWSWEQREEPECDHFNSEGGGITFWFDLLLQQDLLVRNQLHHQNYQNYQNNLVKTS